MYVLVYI